MKAKTRSTVITSRDNSVFRKLTECLTSKGIKKHQMFLCFGAKSAPEMAARAPDQVRNVILPFDREKEFSLPEAIAGRSLALLSLSPELYRELDIFGTHQPIYVLHAPELSIANLAAKPRGLEICAALSDPANLGALLRSAAAFGAARVILLQESATPFHPKAVRAASGSTLATPLFRGPSIKEIANQNTDHLIALDMQGTPIHDFKWPKDARLLIGEEGQGVPQSSAFDKISIPMKSQVESLNATVAASIALFTYSAQNSGPSSAPFSPEDM